MEGGAGWPVYDLWPWTEPLTSGGEQEKVTVMVVGGWLGGGGHTIGFGPIEVLGGGVSEAPDGSVNWSRGTQRETSPGDLDSHQDLGVEMEKREKRGSDQAWGVSPLVATRCSALPSTPPLGAPWGLLMGP